MKTMVPISLMLCLMGCASAPIEKQDKPLPVRHKTDTQSHLFKTDFDRLADLEMAENIASLRLVMKHLYSRNPKELAKSNITQSDIMLDLVFNGGTENRWHSKQINHLEGTDAINLAFDPNFSGDRVLAYTVGLHTMLLKAHGGKKDFFIHDSIEPQSLYNVARNVEIAAWKLKSSRDAKGELFLLSNEINELEQNPVLGHEFGKIIGRTDLLAFTFAEKSERSISRMAQRIATTVFFPF